MPWWVKLTMAISAIVLVAVAPYVAVGIAVLGYILWKADKEEDGES